MGLAEAMGDMPDAPSRYTVDPAARIAAILGIIEIGEYDVLEYSWSGGYERLGYKAHLGGTLDYAGPYHPFDGNCESHSGRWPGVCKWCGSVVW